MDNTEARTAIVVDGKPFDPDEIEIDAVAEGVTRPRIVAGREALLSQGELFK